MSAQDCPPTTDGFLLGGTVHYRQPASGHRSGLEPVLLAASLPVRPGQRVLEAGTGAGAGLLCLHARLPGIGGLGIELDADTAELARHNLHANGASSLTIETADLLSWADDPRRFDHAFANPPWHAGTGSPDARRRLARSAPPDTLDDWVAALSGRLRHGGSLSLAIPAGQLAQAGRSLLAHRCGGMTVLPLWPRVGRPARLLLVQARLGHRAGSRLLPGLVLHDAEGSFTQAAQHVLRDGAALPMV